jgi:phosphopentomutase/2,3-bisphosphoglycerate-independent phosphoglycerate mutase family metalloenzyme/type I phosphodiesterase/nucleotide pyrophosphatase
MSFMSIQSSKTVRWIDMDRLCGLAVAVAVACAAEHYEHALNLARPLVLGVGPPVASRARGPAVRVVWVLVDGLRLDVSRTMPALNRLRAEGNDVSARAEFPTYSGPNFVAQASGIEPAASGVRSNGYPLEVALDSVFRRARMAGLRTAAVTTDPEGGLGRPYASWVDETRIGDRLVSLPPAGMLLVHVGYPDRAAHAHGAASREYAAAAARADAAIDRIARTLDPGRDALVVTADHGNLAEGGHGGTEDVVMRIPIVVWGAGVVPGGKRDGARARDVGPTIASLLGIGPLRHATGRSLLDEDAASARQRAAVRRLLGAADQQPADHVPVPIVVAVVALLALRRRCAADMRARIAAPVYAVVFAALLGATGTNSFSISNDTALFAARVIALAAIAGLAQLLLGGRSSLPPAAFATSLAVFAAAAVAAAQPLAPADGTLRFLPIPAFTALAFVCVLSAVVGTTQPVRERPLRARLGGRRPGDERAAMHRVRTVGDLMQHPLPQLDRREAPAVHATRVDPDLVRRVDENAALGRVAEDDRVGKVVGAHDELFPDPEQVLGLLRLESARRPDAGVHEEEAAGDERQRKPREKREVSLREAPRRLLAFEVSGDAVAPERRRAAVEAPGLAPPPLASEVGQAHVLVIAAQEHGVHVVAPPERQEEIDDGPGLRPSIDVVADERDGVPGAQRQSAEQHVELAGAPVDVADDVERVRHVSATRAASVA